MQPKTKLRIRFRIPNKNRAPISPPSPNTMAPSKLQLKSKKRSSSRLNPKKTKKKKNKVNDNVAEEATKISAVIVDSSPNPNPKKPNNPYLSIPTPKSTGSPSSIKSLLIGIKTYNSSHTPENQSILAAKSLPHTSKHESLINSVLDDFVNCLSSYKDKKWANLLEHIPFDGPGTYTSAPKILIVLGGDKNGDKLQLANFSLIDWMAATKKKAKKKKTVAKKNKNETDEDGCDIDLCPWYQPSTQNQHLRTFFGTVQRVFGWQFQQSDFNFNSGLNGFIKDLYALREKEFGQVRPTCYTCLTSYSI